MGLSAVAPLAVAAILGSKAVWSKARERRACGAVVGGAAIGGSVGDRGGMNDGWNSSRTFDLSSLSSGGGGEAYGGLTPSLQAQLNSMRNEAGRESVDSNSDRLTGAVLSELANSALNELMQQVRPPAARCTRARA